MFFFALQPVLQPDSWAAVSTLYPGVSHARQTDAGWIWSVRVLALLQLDPGRSSWQVPYMEWAGPWPVCCFPFRRLWVGRERKWADCNWIDSWRRYYNTYFSAAFKTDNFFTCGIRRDFWTLSLTAGWERVAFFQNHCRFFCKILNYFHFSTALPITRFFAKTKRIFW